MDEAERLRNTIDELRRDLRLKGTDLVLALEAVITLRKQLKALEKDNHSLRTTIAHQNELLASYYEKTNGPIVISALDAIRCGADASGDLDASP